jgi:hypothetical protein
MRVIRRPERVARQPLALDEHELSALPRPLVWLSVALLIGSLGYGAGLIRQVWHLDPDGLSPATGTLPFWDFSNLWAGGRLAATGCLSDLSDVERYRHALRTLFDLPIRSGEWSYPPTMLLVGWFFARLPIGSAYVVWTAGTVLLHAAAVGLLRLPWRLGVLAVFSPALMWSIALGQNGALTAALLVGGLVCAERRPVLGGVLLGGLAMKPQLALLVPFALLFRGQWRALLAAAATGALLVGLSVMLFGVESWVLFFQRTAPMMRGIMEAPFPQSYQVRAVTPFIFARALGLPLASAYVGQLAATGLCLATVWRQRKADAVTRLTGTILLTFLATPYAYSYDLVAIGGPLMMLALVAARTDRVEPLLWGAWLLPCMPLLPTPFGLLPIGPVLLGALAIRLGRSQPQTAEPRIGDDPRRVKAS